MPAQRRYPAPVRLALQALEAVRVQDPALAARIEKSLPAFALKQAKAGHDLSVDELIAAAALPDFGQGIDAPAKPDFLTRYRQITGLPDIDPRAIDETRHNPLSLAARRGDTQEVVQWLDAGVDVNSANGLALSWAAQHGHRQTVEVLLARGATTMNKHLLSDAVYGGNIDILRLIIAHGADIDTAMPHPLVEAAICGNKDMLILLLDEYGVDINVCDARALTQASSNGHTDIVTLLLERGIDLKVNLKNRENALICTIFKGHTGVLRQLIAHGCDVSHPYYLRTAANNSFFDIALILLDNGAPADVLSDTERGLIARRRDDIARWQRTVRMDPPKGLEAYSTLPFKPHLFEQLEQINRREAYGDGIGRIYAYQAMALFQTEDRVLQYLQKWKTDTIRPLHDIIHMINVPHDLTGVNLKAWGDAVLKHGPRMASLVKFCDRIPTPFTSDDGKTWSYVKTRAEVAKYAYARAAEHPTLAAFCFENAVDDDAFETALELTQKQHPPKNMPDITIDGARFNMAGSVFKKLANDDIRGLFLGEITDCCQSIGGHGRDCATHGFTSPHGGFYAIETAKGEIIGQSWAWRGTKGELCFDSLETLGNRVSPAQWKKLMQETAQELTTRRDHDVTALHVGTGGKTPPSLSAAFTAATASPRDYNGYRDSQKQLRVWKR